MKNIDSNITKIYLTEVTTRTEQSNSSLKLGPIRPTVPSSVSSSININDFLNRREGDMPIWSSELLKNVIPKPNPILEEIERKEIINGEHYPINDSAKIAYLNQIYNDLAGKGQLNNNNNFTKDDFLKINALLVRLNPDQRLPYIKRLFSLIVPKEQVQQIITISNGLNSINGFKEMDDENKQYIYDGLSNLQVNSSFDLTEYFNKKTTPTTESYTQMYTEFFSEKSSLEDTPDFSSLNYKIVKIITKIAEKEDGGDTVIDNILKDIENFTNASVGDNGSDGGKGYGGKASIEAGMGLQGEVGGDEAPNTESEIEKLKAQIRELESVKRLMANGTTQGSDAFRKYMSYLYKYGITNSQPQAITMTRDALKNNGVVIDDEIIKLKEKLEDLSSKQESSGGSGTEPNSDDNDTNAAGGVPKNDNNILNMLGSLPKLHPEEDGNDDGSEENNGDTEEGDLSNTLQNIPQIHDTEDEKSSEGDTTTQNSTLLDTLSGLPPLHSQEEEPRRQGLLNRLFGNPQ
jgi:hypothetical protein